MALGSRRHRVAGLATSPWALTHHRCVRRPNQPAQGSAKTGVGDRSPPQRLSETSEGFARVLSLARWAVARYWLRFGNPGRGHVARGCTFTSASGHRVYCAC